MRVLASDNKSKKLYELSYLNVLFCIMVICVHILSEPITALERTSLQYFSVYAPWKLFQFVTQGFVFLSGLKLFLKDRSDIKIGCFYIDRAKRVVIPYLLWVVIYYLYFIAIGWYEFSAAHLLRYVLIGDLVAHFYFVIIICQMYILTPFIAKLFKKCSPYLALIYSLFISLLLGQYLPHVISIISPDFTFAYNDRLFTTYIFYFIGGAAVGMNYKVVIGKLRKAKATVYTMFALFAISNLVLSYISISGRAYMHWCDTLHFAYCVSAIAALLTFMAGFCEKHAALPRAVSKIIISADNSSYMLYLSHILVILLTRRQLDYMVLDIGQRLIVTAAVLAMYTVLSSLAWDTAKGKIKHRRA
ncbi:MAG: acyltransferase [Ruminococcaceae bacterium]|nr:acyltransferase [Oscillospiraceae bacterium]